MKVNWAKGQVYIMTLYIVLVILSFPFLAQVMRRDNLKKQMPLIILGIFVNIYAFTNIISLAFDGDVRVFNSLFEITCVFILSLSILSFSLRISKYNQIKFFNFSVEKLVIISALLLSSTVIIFSSFVFGISVEVNYYIVVLGLSIVSFFIILQLFLDSIFPLSIYAFFVLAGAALPTLVLLIDGLLFVNNLPSSILVITYMVSGYQYLYLVRNEKLLGQLSISRESVIENMDDGWMILDENDHIQDANAIVSKMLGMNLEDMFKEKFHRFLAEFPAKENWHQEIEMRKSMKLNDEWRYFNVRISPLQDQKQTRLGRLVIWRDITDRKITENARQRARDEMFVLLNSISNAASQSHSLEDFLSDLIFQLVYPFSSQLVLIFLNDERKKHEDNPKLFLAAKYGVSADVTGNMEDGLANSPAFQGVLNAGHPVNYSVENEIIRDGFGDCLNDMSQVLLVPLTIKTQQAHRVIGLMLLARQEDRIYSVDEIVRIETLAAQIAITVDSDRRKKLAIVISERQRLLRDLHDSVSQKLYGLVTLTEALQAAREAGVDLNLTEYITRIGENARQAVKEMRLFLYQLQPVDIEREGLVSTLHYRLAAVEGRADIKARLLADGDINLTGEKQIALFFVAQEALNNVLRHAQAREVTVTLKQGRKYVHLHVIDDGRGFDPRKLEKGGLGLNTMWERVLLVGGTFRIRSKPGKGTMVLVSVPLEN